MNCPECNAEINVASLMAKARWKKTTKKERIEHGRKLVAFRKCKCGLPWSHTGKHNHIKL